MTSSADKALKLSEMGLEVSVSTVKKVSASVDINAVKTQITKFEGVMRDSNVPVLDPPVVPPKVDVPPAKMSDTPVGTGKTGTVWDSIKSEGSLHPGSVIP